MKKFWILIGVLLVLSSSAGMVYKLFFQATSKTVIGRGGKQVIVNTDAPRQSLFNFGCTNLQLDVYWRKSRMFPTFANEKGDSRVDKISNRVGR